MPPRFAVPRADTAALFVWHHGFVLKSSTTYDRDTFGGDALRSPGNAGD